MFMKKLNSGLLLCLLMATTGPALFSGCSARNIHPELHQDRRILVRQWTRSTRTEWKAGQQETEYSNPIFYDNTLIFGNRSVGLISLYPGLNQVRWALPIENGISSAITVHRDAVYFGGGDGFLYSVNAENGRVNWRYELRTPFVSKPTVRSGRVFVTTGNDVVYCFDAGSGQWVWHYRRRSDSTATILGASSPLVVGPNLVAGLSDGFLVALSVDDGTLKWERKLHFGRKFTDVDAEAVLDGSVIYVPSYDGALYALSRRNAEVIWKFDAGGSKTVQIEGRRIFLPSSDGHVYALDKENGKVFWKFQLDGGTPTQLALSERYIFVGSSQEYFYVIDKNTGKGLYRYHVGYGSGFSGAPAFDPVKSRLYVLSGGGNLFSFLVRQPRRKILPRGMSDPYL